MKKLNTFIISYLCGKNYFEKDGTQNWFVFQPKGKYLKVTYKNNIGYILSWKSKELSDLEIKSFNLLNHLLNPHIDKYDMSKIRIKFNGNFLNRFPPSIIHDKIVNIYIVYKMSNYFHDSNHPTTENYLSGSVKLTKNADINKCKYLGYGIGFDRIEFFSIGNDTGRNVIIFGLDMS